MCVMKLSKKKILVTAICFFLAAVIGYGGYVLYLYSYPDGCKEVLMRDGCAKVNADGTIVWTGTWQYLFIHRDFPDETMMEVRQLAATLRTLPLKKTDELPTDVQIIEISFTPEEHDFQNKYLCTCIAYDFYTKKVYVNKGGTKWYLLKDEDILDSYIYKAFFRSHGEIWYGQSTKNTVGVETYDHDNATFRYNMHWKLTPETLYEAMPEQMAEQAKEAILSLRFDGSVQTEGFRNTDEKRISTREEALSRAAEELGYDDPIGTTFFDETCGYWMVELYDDSTFQELQKEFNVPQALYESVHRVIMDDRGRTIAISNTYTDIDAFDVWVQYKKS